MDKAEALHDFWASFDLPAIDENSAWDDETLEQLGITFPYISYESATSDLDDVLTLGADIWDRSPSWATVEAKAKEILDAIGLGGSIVFYDIGALWITRGAAKRMASGDDAIRRIHIDINAEFLSA